MSGSARGHHQSVTLLGEQLAIDENGRLTHWIEPCMDCGRNRECYRIASLTSTDVWWGVCAECIAIRVDDNARDVAKRALDRAWELPQSIWAECEICQTLEPVDQLERRGEGWVCVAKHDDEE